MSRQYSGGRRTYQAKVHASGSTVRVVHKEYITDISVLITGAFNTQTFELNPGLTTVFPWLSNMSVNYGMYKFNYLRFDYLSQCADDIGTANTPVLGMVVLTSTTDPHDAPFTNKQQMENKAGSVTGKISGNYSHVVRTGGQAMKYIRTGTELTTNGAANQDQRLFDAGNFQIATQGFVNAAGATFTGGELHVVYDVTFYKPEMPQTMSNYNSCHYWLANPSSVNQWGTLIPALATNATTPDRRDRIGITFSITGANFATLNWPAGKAGRYLFVFTANQGAIAITNPVFTLTGGLAWMGATGPDQFNGVSLTYNPAVVTAGLIPDEMIYCRVIISSGVAGTIVPTVVAGPVWGGNGGDLYITPLDNS